MSSNNIFQMSQELRQQLDWLNTIMIGSAFESVNIHGVVKPSISKDIADNFQLLQSMVIGRQPFATLTALIESGAPSSNILSEVWNDRIVSNNGIYGWNGAKWIKSPYDQAPMHALVPDQNFRAVSSNAVTSYFSASTDNDDQRAQGGSLSLGIYGAGNSENKILPLVPCRDAVVRSLFNVDYWQPLKKGEFVTDLGTTNNVYLKHALKVPIKAGDWVQVAFIIKKQGSLYPYLDGPVILMTPLVFLRDSVASYQDVTDDIRIVWHTVQATEDYSSSELLIGSQFGALENDVYIGGWGCRVVKQQPVGLIVDLSLQKLSIKLERIGDVYEQLTDSYLPTVFDANERLSNFLAEKWVNPPPADAIVVNSDEQLKRKFNIDYFVKLQANIGYSDGGLYNNLYMIEDVEPSLINHKYLTSVFVVRKDHVEHDFPNFGFAFTFNPMQKIPITFKEIYIDELTSIFIGYIKIDTNSSSQISIGGNFGLHSNDIYIGGWRLYITDEPLLSPPNCFETIQTQLNSLLPAIEQNSASIKQNSADIAEIKKSKSTDVYYALGDSITWGAGSSSGSTSWADKLHAMNGFKDFVKLARNGATAKPTAGRQKLTDQVAAVNADATLITILIGANDYNLNNPVGDVAAALALPYEQLNINADFSQAYRWSMETLKRQRNTARIFALLPLQTTWPGDEPIQHYRDAIIKIANSLSICVIHADSESGLWEGDRGLMPDGIHPSDTGYDLLSRYVNRKIHG